MKEDFSKIAAQGLYAFVADIYPLPARRLPPLRWEMNCVTYSLDFPFCLWYNIFS